MQKLNTVKGTKDLFGDIVNSHQKIYKIFSEISSFFNFQLISTPILENEKIFIKTLGKSSDIISKEMYNFTDQGGDNLVLRPEGTAAVARALISNSLQEDHNKSFSYYGPNSNIISLELEELFYNKDKKTPIGHSLIHQ